MSRRESKPLELTIQRIFDDPPLSGAIPQQIQYAPDGRRIAYLKAANDQHERLDLWSFDLDERASRALIDSSRLSNGSVELSDEEKARRERTRTSATGIVEYEWLPESSGIVFPLDGRAHRLQLSTGELAALTPAERFVTHLKVSPRGTWLAYLSESDLHVVEIATGRVRQLTKDGGDTVSNGLADFIAQEEMQRLDGYWWSPDERCLAFTRVDESPVATSQRYEINAGEITLHAQRYPFAGEANARVDLHVVELSSGHVRNIEWRLEADDYLARVWWTGNAELAFVRQRRNQTRMELVFADLDGHSRQVLAECSDTWVNLHDDFAIIDSLDAFVWSSERGGMNQLYLYRRDGELEKPLTAIDGNVTKLLCVDEDKRLVYFQGWREDPVEQHLFAVSLDEGERLTQLTTASGCHDITMSPDCSTFVDQHSSVTQPPRVLLRRADGTREFDIDANELNQEHPYGPFASAHATPQFGHLHAEDGQRLAFRITRPPQSSTSPHPAVVVVYGGPGGQRVRNQWSPLFQQYLARQGYVVMELDNRGSSNRGRGFEAPIHLRLGEVEVRDQIRGAEHLADLPYVDATRIGILGDSYGGYMAIMCLAKASKHFRCAVAVAPVTDWRLYDTHYTERYLGQPEENPEGYRASSVFPYLAGLSAPLLLMHGMADDNVLFTHSTRLMQALQDQGTLFELMTYPGAKHGLAGRAISVHRYRVIADFFSRHLKCES